MLEFDDGKIWKPKHFRHINARAVLLWLEFGDKTWSQYISERWGRLRRIINNEYNPQCLKCHMMFAKADKLAKHTMGAHSTHGEFKLIPMHFLQL